MYRNRPLETQKSGRIPGIRYLLLAVLGEKNPPVANIQ